MHKAKVGVTEGISKESRHNVMLSGKRHGETEA
jgi:hypothetical protein